MKIRTIKELREALKMTQVDFAKALGTAQGNVSSWEAGKWKPSAALLNKMIKLAKNKNVKVSYEDLLDD